MKYIIEISERVVSHVKIDYMDISDNDCAMMCDAVRTAIPYEERPHGECRTCKNFVRGGLDGKTYVCEHPHIELDDYFDYACITKD